MRYVSNERRLISKKFQNVKLLNRKQTFSREVVKLYENKEKNCRRL